MPRKLTEEQLTAYVLNELNDKERKIIEKAVQNNPELMKGIKILKEFCQTVKYENLNAPLPTLTYFQHRTIRNRLVEKPAKEKYKIMYLFEWKIMVPALCLSVLALIIFLKAPSQMFSRKDVTDLKQFNMASNHLIEKGDNGIGGKTLFVDNSVTKKRLFKRYNPMQLVNNSVETRYMSPHYDLENYDIIFRNKTKPVADNSSYALPINTNTFSYNNVRQMLNNNQMPPKDVVKIEEMINYFDYNYSSSEQDIPFSVITEISKSPWNIKHKLMHIGFKGRKKIEKNTSHSSEFSKPIITAKNVKIRLEFNPDKIKTYRLIGYDNRNFGDKNLYHNCEMYAKDLCAGQIGTVLYELIPADSRGALKSNKIMTLKFGYRLPDKDQWRIFIYPVMERYVQFDQTSDNFRFSAAVATFGMLLKNSEHYRNLSYSDVKNIAKGSKGKDKKGDRAEFIRLVETAKILDKKKLNKN